jgi:hypothetical protein
MMTTITIVATTVSARSAAACWAICSTLAEKQRAITAVCIAEVGCGKAQW